MRTFAIACCAIQAFLWATHFGYMLGLTDSPLNKGPSNRFAVPGVVALFASIANIIAIWVITT